MAETIYAVSGDVRESMSVGMNPSATNYKGEIQLPGVLITRGGRSATRYINGKLEAVYPDIVPWAEGSVPVLIVEIANELAECWIRTKQHPGPAPMSKDVSDPCAAVKETLQEIADGKMKLPEITASTPFDDVGHTRGDYTPVFDMDDVVNQKVDPDLLEDIGESRE